MKTPEGHHEPGETHSGLGVKAQNIVNDLHHKLDTYHATFGLTLHQQSQGAPTAVPSVFQLP